MSSRIPGKTREALRRLRSCARPSEESASSAMLKKRCVENADEWVTKLKGVVLKGLLPERPPRPSAQETTRRHLEAFLKRHGNTEAGTKEIMALLHKVHGKAGGEVSKQEAGGKAAEASKQEEEVGGDAAESFTEEACGDAAVASKQEEDPARRAVATRVFHLYPKEWCATGNLYDWDPAKWDDADVAAVTQALERRDNLGGRASPTDKGWPSLKGSSHNVKPECGLYKKEPECVWPCAWKKGKKDKTKMCRPARKS